MSETGWNQLPCPFCNVLAFENGSTYGGLVVRGAIRDDKMVDHFGSCPHVNPVLNPALGKFMARNARRPYVNEKFLLVLLLLFSHAAALLGGMAFASNRRVVDLMHLTHLEGLASELVTSSNRNSEALHAELDQTAKRNDAQIQNIRDEYGDAMGNVFKLLRRVEPAKVAKGG